jgi:hypothetical protein
MSSTSSQQKLNLTEVVSRLVTEDDEPVDNLFSAKQQRLLVEPLYSSWTPLPREAEDDDELPTNQPRPFLADANVGIFFAVNQPPLVPDMFLSLDIAAGTDWNADERRSYLVWDFGKVPEVAVEIVSNLEGEETGRKLRRYAEWGITYYVVFDPFKLLGATALCVYELGFGKRLRPRPDMSLPTLGLSVKLWEGDYEGIHDTWLRWCDAEGKLIPTGKEGREQAEQRATRAEAEVARLRAELARLSQTPTT